MLRGGVVKKAAIGLQPLHLVEVQRQACRLAVAAEGTPEIFAVARPDGGASGRNLDRDHVPVAQPDDFDARRERWARAMGDQRLEPQWIRTAGMAWACSRDASAVFHSNEQPTRGIAWPVGETDDRLDEVAI